MLRRSRNYHLGIVVCSLLSHYTLTPNELICLTPAAIRRSLFIEV